MKLGGDLIKKEQAYGALAQQFLADQDATPFTIKKGMPEWHQWQRYFVDHLGFEPFAMKLARTGQTDQMTVPTRWPDEFDPEFKPND